MSEPMIIPVEPKSVDPEVELATLRRVNGELVQKSATRKAKVTELEATVLDLQGKLTESASTIHGLTVGAPLKAMAASVSVDPEYFLEQFGRGYKVEMVEGKLTLQTNDGKAVMKDGKPVPFERGALVELLTTGEGTQAKVYRSILIATLASGANGGQSGNRPLNGSASAKPIQFGLR